VTEARDELEVVRDRVAAGADKRQTFLAAGHGFDLTALLFEEGVSRAADGFSFASNSSAWTGASLKA
jgi:hypothetical protein